MTEAEKFVDRLYHHRIYTWELRNMCYDFIGELEDVYGEIFSYSYDYGQFFEIIAPEDFDEFDIVESILQTHFSELGYSIEGETITLWIII